MRSVRSVWVAVALLSSLATIPTTVVGEEIETDEARQARLAREFSDPLTSVPQIFVQDVYGPANYGTEAATNRVTARLLVPRIPRFRLFPFVQLVRPSISLVTVPTGRGTETRTELGDMQLFDLFVLPWPKRDTGLMLGFGPVFVFPTATHDSAGQGAWQVGPAFAAVYKGIPGLLLGCLIQNPISFAYTSSDRPALNTLLVQPLFLMHLWRGLYAKSADASWAIGWHDGAPRTFPLSFGLGYVFLRENSPPINLSISGEWMAYRENTVVAPQTSVKFGLTIPFAGVEAW